MSLIQQIMMSLLWLTKISSKNVEEVSKYPNNLKI